ncbi:MAG: hypothetical protein ACTSUD_10400 [Alphaproteobacteria bacterium]
MARDDTFWGRIGQLSLDGLAYIATAVAAAPAALLIAFLCVSSGS